MRGRTWLAVLDDLEADLLTRQEYARPRPDTAEPSPARVDTATLDDELGALPPEHADRARGLLRAMHEQAAELQREQERLAVELQRVNALGGQRWPLSVGDAAGNGYEAHA